MIVLPDHKNLIFFIYFFMNLSVGICLIDLTTVDYPDPEQNLVMVKFLNIPASKFCVTGSSSSVGRVSASGNGRSQVSIPGRDIPKLLKWY